MTRREQLLAIAAGLLIALLLLYVGVRRVGQAFATRHSRLETLEREVNDKRFRGEVALQLSDELAEWEQRSLPSESNIARTLYQNWLVGVADRVRLSNVAVDAGGETSQRGIYIRLPFTLRARGSLEQVVQLLHEFYSSAHLHQIRDTRLSPLENSSELDLMFVIEALVLPGADRTDRLNSKPLARLALADVDDYRMVIGQRNPFAAYQRPAETPRPAPVAQQPPAFDPAGFAILTAIVQVNAEPEAWINVRPTGQLLRLRQQDAIQVGTFKGTISRIGVDELEIEANGQRWLMALGQSLKEAAPRRP